MSLQSSGVPAAKTLRYNASAPTIPAGDVAEPQADVNGNQKVTLGTLIHGEDPTNDVLKVEGQFTHSGILAADAQVKASAGLLHSLTFMCNDAAPTAGSIIVYDNTAESGTQVFNHTFTTTPFAPFTVLLDIEMANGIYVGFTTTADVNVVAAYR